MSIERFKRNHISRRDALQTVTIGAFAASLPLNQKPAATVMPAPTALDNPLAAERLIWKLDRPKPALANSYFWTWDHSANWLWDDPGMLNFGCKNRYLKRPATFLEDYRRLTDLSAGLGVRGIVIWGFLRDAHGGVAYAKRVADYAAERGVSVMPGVGTTWYGGAYYEGDHPYNIETFVKRYPEARQMDGEGNRNPHGVCPTHPGFIEWLQESIHWLFKEFAIGGVNLENGDFKICHCPRCTEQQAQWPEDEPLFWFHQYLGYEPALQALRDQPRDKLITWATYKGFAPGRAEGKQKQAAYMECRRPAMFDRLPTDNLCQWTLTYMVRQTPLALTQYLDDGAPKEALSCETWPSNLKPPFGRNVGFLHQGSQWYEHSRYQQLISSIKESCLRAYRSGLEGLSIHGEVSSMHIPYALNYLAFSHFIHWPEDSLRQFGRKTLGQVFSSEEEGEIFIEHLAHFDAAALTDEMKKDITKRCREYSDSVTQGVNLTRYRFWNWLDRLSHSEYELQTVNNY
jgi:hypothetical protein